MYYPNGNYILAQLIKDFKSGDFNIYLEKNEEQQIFDKKYDIKKIHFTTFKEMKGKGEAAKWTWKTLLN